MIEIIDVRDADDWEADEEAHKFFMVQAERILNEKLSVLSSKVASEGRKVTEEDIHNAVMSALTFRRG